MSFMHSILSLKLGVTDIKRRKCKDLCKELKALKQAFDELNASHERLEEAHEKLGDENMTPSEITMQM